MAGSKNLAEDPYERLANAIVLQAVSDYRVALKKIKAHPKNREAISEALEIEKFFRSGWYSILTDVDGEYGLNQRIESKLGQIEELHDLATKATVTYSDMPRNPNKGHSRLEDAVIKIIELENEINKDMVELVELKKDIIRRIKAVESTELQTVLELRYLSYMRWEEIAIELGYGIDNVFRLHRNALDEIKIRFLKQYSKIKFDTVSLCDIVKMAKG